MLFTVIFFVQTIFAKSCCIYCNLVTILSSCGLTDISFTSCIPHLEPENHNIQLFPPKVVY